MSELQFVALEPGSVHRDYVPKDEADLLRCLGDPFWRVESGCLYKITIKAGDGETLVPFRPNRAQRRFMRRLWHRNVILKARQLGFCLDPSQRVLTADLRWVPIGEIQPGTEVVAVDEHPPGGRGSGRKMRTATVQAVKTMKAERFRISFDDGREVICTANHPWLSRKVRTDLKWRSLSGSGNEVTGRLKVGTQVRWVAKPWDAPTVEDGWFGGMLDGEGSMAKGNSSAGVNVSQRHGPVWDRLVKYATDRGYSFCIESDQAERPSKHGRVPVPKLAFGRMDEMFRLLGQTRPTRFIDRRFWEDRELPGKRNGDVGWATITSIEPLGVGDVVDMQTSTGTYIAEGFVSHNTTLISILWLDHALFNSDQLCVQVAQTREDAEAIFKGKVVKAYDNLPPALLAARPTKQKTATQIEFSNGSIVRVATSARGGTPHRLHVSEMGKIGAKFPEKSREIVSGSFPAVPMDGIIVVESTAEGQAGDFKKIVDEARELAQKGVELNPKQFRFHFYPWWQEVAYRLPEMQARHVPITAKEHEYFDKLEATVGVEITLGQRAWWISTFESECLSDPELMWREYPSTPDEAFQVSTDGTFLAEQLKRARESGRIGAFPHVDGFPVNTFWDIGSSDGTAIWLHQHVAGMDRFFHFIEGWEKPYSHFIKELQDVGVKHSITWGVHYLPHDAEHERQQANKVASPKSELESLKGIGGRWDVVPRVDALIHGISKLRQRFSTYCFDETGCKQGIAHLTAYRKKWHRATSTWSDEPVKQGGHTEAADAIRQHAQGYVAKSFAEKPKAGKPRKNWRAV